MIIKYLDRVINVTKLYSHIGNLEEGNYNGVDFRIDKGLSFWSFGLVPVHPDSITKRGKFIYHLVIRNSGILICDTTKNTSNSKIQHPGSIVGIDITQLHQTIYDYRIEYIGQERNMITVPLIFNYPLPKSELIREFNSIIN